MEDTASKLQSPIKPATTLDVTESPDPRKQSEKQTTSLLDLPPELVLKVLGFAVVTSNKDEPIQVDTTYRQKAKHPAITRTCRLLRNEGLKLFYTSNVFLANGRENAVLIRKLWVEIPDHHGFSKHPWYNRIGERRSMIVSLSNWGIAKDPVGAIGHTWIHTRAGAVVLDRGPMFRILFRGDASEENQWTHGKEVLNRLVKFTRGGPDSRDWYVPVEGLSQEDIVRT